MKVKFATRKFTLTDDVKQRVEKKLSKFDKFFGEDAEATVRLSSQGFEENVEITIMCKGVTFRAEESDKDYKCALDRAVENIERQNRKNRTRLEKRRVYVKNDLPELIGEENDEEIRISKVKQFALSPMTPEEAVLQMNLLGHVFFMFRNAETGEVNVVYKRKSDDYGLISPAE